MKMMHEIRADAGGQLAEVCVGNGQPVSTGDVLFKLS
jgi:biotin carboxyl carrier protein